MYYSVYCNFVGAWSGLLHKFFAGEIKKVSVYFCGFFINFTEYKLAARRGEK